MITTVIFDMDGVLIDTESAHVESVVRTFAEFGVTLDKTDCASIVANHPDTYLPVFARKHKLSHDVKGLSELSVSLIRNYTELWGEQVKLMPSVLSTLNELKQLNLRMAIATSSKREFVEELLERFDLRKYFSVSISGNDVTHRKPHPEIYEKAVAALGVSKREIVVIEDSEVGVVAAKAAGLKVFAVPNEHTRSHDFSKADKILSNLDEIPGEIVAGR